jgi:hypothetical protein
MRRLCRLVVKRLGGEPTVAEDREFQYVTIVGFNYLQPIAALLERLLLLEKRGPAEVQASPIENGYSVAILVLTVLMIESSIRRTQYVLGSLSQKSALVFAKEQLPTCPLIPDLEEAFVARDVVAHNHVYEATVTWEPPSSLRLLGANHLSDGDAKFNRVVDRSTLKTRRLGLNLFPTRVCLHDVAVILKLAHDFFSFLEKTDRRYFYISPQIVEFQHRLVSFQDLAESAGKALGAA